VVAINLRLSLCRLMLKDVVWTQNNSGYGSGEGVIMPIWIVARRLRYPALREPAQTHGIRGRLSVRE
jgi:hypothetical protein